MRTLALLLLASLAAQSQSLAADYARLLHPQFSRAATVHAVAFQWEGMRFLFADGELAMTDSTAGASGVAVFTGRGASQVLPADNPLGALERGQMLRFQGRSEIAVLFDGAVFRFGDSAVFASALGASVHFTPGNTEPAAKLFARRIKFEESNRVPLLGRWLQAAAQPRSRLLYASLFMRGGDWVEAQFDASADPREDSAARIFVWAPAPATDALVPEIWSAYSLDEAPAAPAPRISDYSISATVSDHPELDALATLTLDRASASRLLLFTLGSDLKIGKVEVPGAAGATEALDWLQPDHAAWFAVRVPPAVASAAPLQLRVSYSGTAPAVLGAAGHEALASPGWYPTLGADPLASLPPAPADFDLTFLTDKQDHLVASGVRVGAESEMDGHLRTEWRSRAALRAGFAIGRDQLAEKTVQLANGSEVPLLLSAPSHDAASLLPLAGGRLVNILDFLTARFGPYPFPSVTATLAGSADVDLPPSPGMIALDPGSFLDLDPSLTEFEPAAQAAAQWWGARTPPATVHDQWLEAGLRQISGLLYQQSRYGLDSSLATVQAWRKFLLQRDPDSGHVPVRTGALWLGAARLSSSRDDGGALLAAKGGYVLYMLRQMMFNPQSPDPDASFTAALRDFAAAAGGRAASSAEFQTAMERHMTPAMDLDGNRKLDWFFGPWLRGDTVPSITFTADLAPAANGKPQVTLAVDNPQHWRGLLPVYVFRDETTWVRGLIPVTKDHLSQTLPVPFVPRFVEADHLLDMLVQIKQ